MTRQLPSRWQGALIVCGKCSKRLEGGFGKGGRQSLAKALKVASGGGRRRKSPLGIIESKCLGVCPGGAVVLIDGRAPDSWWLVKRGSDPMAVLAEIEAAREASCADGGGGSA